MNAPGSAPWRLLVHGPDDGAWNMAVDESILEAYLDDPPPRGPTLRLYAWDPPALSLGRGQDGPASHDDAWLRSAAVDLVRRPTGGLAVLHEHERTYAVVGRLRTPPFDGAVVETYRRISEALRTALRQFGIPATAAAGRADGPRAGGPAACFQGSSVHELVAEERKLVGSAQLRRHGAFLQHGSIPLRVDPVRLGQAIGAPVDAARFTDLTAALGGPADPQALDLALVAGFERTFGVELRAGTLTEGEKSRAAQLRCWKYDSATWTIDGRTGRREQRWGPRI